MLCTQKRTKINNLVPLRLILALMITLHSLEYFVDYEEKYEEKTFWIFVHLMHEKNWRSVFKDGTPKLLEMTKYFEKELCLQAPEICERVEDTNVNRLSFFTIPKHLSLSSLLVFSSAKCSLPYF